MTDSPETLPRKIVFVGGLYKSGITPLVEALIDHPQIGGFRDGEVPENEGQYAQSVFPSAKQCGGANDFGFHANGHMTEASDLVTSENRERLLQEWDQHWDRSKDVLLERSTTNLIRARFLQAVFPEAFFIIVMRHPLSASLAVAKWNGERTNRSISHWLACHELFDEDREYIRRLHVVKHEDLIARPQEVLEGVQSFLGVRAYKHKVKPHAEPSISFATIWNALHKSSDPKDAVDAGRISEAYGQRVKKFGYALPESPRAPSVWIPNSSSEAGDAGEANTCDDRGPDFLILGAQKAGTSSLFVYLTQHPQVVPPIRKELHFFDHPSEYRRGMGWYTNFFPDPSNSPEGFPRITGEGTPYYLFHPRIPRQVAKHFPDVKLISVLRNPIDRAYSHYQMSLRKDRKVHATFEAAIEAAPGLLAGEAEKMLADDSYESKPHRQYSYLARGLYYDQLRRWEEFFPRERMMVLHSDNLLHNRSATVNRVFDFLGLPHWETSYSKLYNVYPYPPMNPKTREQLAEYFEPHNQKLYEYLGEDFGWR